MARKPRRYLALKGNTYWFKRDIPAAIRGQFGGKTAHLVCLETGDIRQAQRRRDEIETECDRLFADARAGRRMSGHIDAIQELGETWRKHRADSQVDGLAWTANYLGYSEDALADEDTESVDALIREEGERIERLHGEEASSRFADIVYGRVASDHYLEDYLKEAHIAPKTRNERRGLVRRFATWAETKRLTLDCIGRRQVSDYVSTNIVPMHRRTAKKHLTALRGYWDYLKRRDHVADAGLWDDLLLPDRGRRAERGDRVTERPFTDDEMRTLLYAPYPAERLSDRFAEQIADAIRIAALTGMRQAEILTLQVGECCEDWINVGQGKNAAAVRRVPVHPALKDILARRVKGREAEGWLFAELSAERDPGDTFGKRFARYREALGVDDKREGRRRSLVNFHSFRRWFITQAERAGQPESTIALVVGHTEGRRSVTFGTYSEGVSTQQLRACVEAVQLPDRG